MSEAQPGRIDEREAADVEDDADALALGAFQDVGEVRCRGEVELADCTDDGRLPGDDSRHLEGRGVGAALESESSEYASGSESDDGSEAERRLSQRQAFLANVRDARPRAGLAPWPDRTSARQK
jgi:hypothetical protein